MEVSFKENIEAQRAIFLIKHTNKSLFLTGKAGTGKSTLLRHIVSSCDKKHVLLAPTGIAALNIGGQTIHSFFKFGLRPYLPNDQGIQILLDKIDLLRKLDIIIIDEISMVRVDIMNAIDLTLKKCLKNEQPFGGKQMLFVGDLLQLPPVITGRDTQIIRDNYSTEYFFSAKIFDSHDLDVIELQTVYRQEQGDFVKILNNIRVNQASNSDLARMNTRKVLLPIDETIVTLTTTNHNVGQINEKRLSIIQGQEYHFFAQMSGTFKPNEKANYPTDDILRLKEGSQIIFVKNDPEKKWVNGTIGKIKSLSNEEIEIEVNNRMFIIQPVTWEDIEYKWNKEKNEIEQTVVGTFTQYPIKLAWAITIHKSQGQTFEKAIIDLDTGAFANGQTYVALSRCTSLDGIILTKNVSQNDIKVSPHVVKYLLSKGLDLLTKRDSLELELVEKIQQLDNEIKIKNQYIEAENEKTKRIEAEKELAFKNMNSVELDMQRLKMENEYMRKEIDRLKSITWIQKLFGTK